MIAPGRLLSVGIICLAVCASSEAEPGQVQQSLDRWRAAEVDDYVYAYRKFCECQRDQPPQTVVSVRDGRVVDVYHLHADSDRRVPARAGSLDYYWTIDELFDLIRSAAERGAEVRAEFDPELGYPTEVYVDYTPEVIGDEIDIRLTDWQAAST